MVMIPVEAVEAPESERRVFERLEKELGDGWVVFHSLDVCSRNREGKLIDAEIDFLILSPDWGLLVLEVKGGAIRFDGAAGKWSQNGRPLKMGPFEQARLNKIAITKFLEARCGERHGIPVFHAVCFPDATREPAGLPAEADRSIIITGTELPFIGKAIESVFERSAGEGAAPVPSHVTEKARRVLAPAFECGASLVDRMAAADRRIFSLTEEQCALLDFLGERKRVLVRGCVGSGKTLLAVKKARELSLRGKSVLLLCYNQPLGRHLARAVEDLGGMVTAKTYHAFCRAVLEAAGEPLDVRQGRDFWENEVPERFARLLKKRPLKFDAVIVDEGQDFKVSFWVTIEELLAEGGWFYVFYDPEQNLFGSEMQLPIDDEPFVLKTNCRNTRRICAEVARHSEGKPGPREGAPEGEPIVEKHCPTDAERRKELSRILHHLVEEEKIPEERIVVIGGHTIEHTCLASDRRVGNFTVEPEPREDPPPPRARGVIPYYSYMRFKGCESDAVILVDVDPADERWRHPRALYTAASRARLLLYVLYK